MNFVTLTYLVFLAVVVVLYWALPRRLGRWWLIVASLVFFGSWNPVYVPGFAILLFGNWQLAFVARTRPTLGVAAAVVLDIGVVEIFKVQRLGPRSERERPHADQRVPGSDRSRRNHPAACDPRRGRARWRA
ncbi:MAG TPA: hypothetical protein VGP30_04975 [Candidatus Limnocylindrales bacterium]|nr:hypothetical protein [Candidatus Limnocylindrales bacterium]